MSMSNVIKLTDIQINDNRMIDGRKLHAFLEVETRFDTWWKRKIKYLNLLQPTDFIEIRNDHNYIMELHVALDVAKAVCMVEKSPKGKEARDYFIDIEKRFTRMFNLTPAERLLESAKIAVEHERRLGEHDVKIAKLETKVSVLKQVDPENGYLSVLAYCNENNLRLPKEHMKWIGKAASAYCKQNDIARGTVPDARWGKVNTYPTDVLDIISKMLPE